MAERSKKKVWSRPTLVVYGNVEEITAGCDKNYGTSDGYTFQGQAIVCTGS